MTDEFEEAEAEARRTNCRAGLELVARARRKARQREITEAKSKAAAWDVLVKISAAAVALQEEKGVIVTPSYVGDCVHLEVVNVSTMPGMKFTLVTDAKQFVLCPERWVWRFVRGANRPLGLVDGELTVEDLLGEPYVPEDDRFADEFTEGENTAGPILGDDRASPLLADGSYDPNIDSSGRHLLSHDDDDGFVGEVG